MSDTNKDKEEYFTKEEDIYEGDTFITGDLYSSATTLKGSDIQKQLNKIKTEQSLEEGESYYTLLSNTKEKSHIVLSVELDLFIEVY